MPNSQSASRWRSNLFQHVQAAWARPDLTSPIQQIVLLFLADKANNDGVMWWSVPSIAKACRASEKTVRVALKEMLDNGVIGTEGAPRPGTVTHWLVSDDPTFLFKTPVVNTRVRRRGPKPTPVVNTDHPGSKYQATPVFMTTTPVVNTDKATKKQPTKQPTKQMHMAAADAAPAPQAKAKPAKADKTEARRSLNEKIVAIRILFAELFDKATERDQQYMGRNIQDAVGLYDLEDATGTLRAIAAQCPDAKAKGRTISLIDFGSLIAEWVAFGRPALFPRAVPMLRSGGTNDRPTSRLAATSQRATDRDGWRQLKQSLQTGGMAASAG